jgi:hypothetical protein
VPAFGRRAFPRLVGPEVIFGLTGDVARVLERRRSVFDQTADMVAMHMGECHDGDLVRHVTRRFQAVL